VTTSGCVDHVVAWAAIQQPSLPRPPVLIPPSVNTHLIAEGNSEQLAASLRSRERTYIKFIKRHRENDVLWGVTSCSMSESCRRFEKT
jgi:hypothetical protein